MSHVKGHKETKWERFKRRLRDNKKTRAEQFANYLNMVDSYSKKRVSLKGSMVQLGNLKMSTVMDKYHDKALRLAQAKYYQKQVG